MSLTPKNCFGMTGNQAPRSKRHPTVQYLRDRWRRTESRGLSTFREGTAKSKPFQHLLAKLLAKITQESLGRGGILIFGILPSTSSSVSPSLLPSLLPHARGCSPALARPALGRSPCLFLKRRERRERRTNPEEMQHRLKSDAAWFETSACEQLGHPHRVGKNHIIGQAAHSRKCALHV